MHKENRKDQHTADNSNATLGVVGSSFVVRRGLPRFPYYWKNGEWIKDKADATRYSWNEAEQLANQLNCAFTDAE